MRLAKWNGTIPAEGKGDEESNIVDPQSWGDDPMEDAWRGAQEAYQARNMEEMMKFLQQYEKLLDEENEK